MLESVGQTSLDCSVGHLDSVPRAEGLQSRVSAGAERRGDAISALAHFRPVRPAPGPTHAQHAISVTAASSHDSLLQFYIGKTGLTQQDHFHPFAPREG